MALGLDIAVLDGPDNIVNCVHHIVNVLGGQPAHIDAPFLQEVDMVVADQVIDLLGWKEKCTADSFVCFAALRLGNEGEKIMSID